MLGPAIKSIILNDAAIAALVENRLFPVSDFGQGLPAIYYIVSAVPDYVKNGPTMTDWRISLVTMHNAYTEAWQLSMLIKQAFDRANRHTIEGIQFQTLRCTSITDDYEFQINSFGQKIEIQVRTNNIKV